jgi:hypothetical protein
VKLIKILKSLLPPSSPEATVVEEVERLKAPLHVPVGVAPLT